MKITNRDFKQKVRENNRMTNVFTLMLKQLKDGKKISYDTKQSAIYVERCFDILFNEKVKCTRLSDISIKIELIKNNNKNGEK